MSGRCIAPVLFVAVLVRCGNETPPCAEGTYQVTLGDLIEDDGTSCEHEFWTGATVLELDVSGTASDGGGDACYRVEAELSPLPPEITSEALATTTSSLPGRVVINTQPMSYRLGECLLQGRMQLLVTEGSGTFDEVLEKSSDVRALFVWDTEGPDCATVNPEDIVCTNLYEADVTKL